MKISATPEFLESVANDPRVFPAIARKGITEARFGPVWHECIGLEFETGGWLLHRLEPGLYECHTLFLPKSRNVRELAREAFMFTFCCTDALEVITKVPADLPHVKALAEAVGFRHLYRREDVWERESGPVAMDYYRITLDEWIVGNPALIGLGQWFHDQLGEAHVNHAECAVHDAYAGYATACGKQGQLAKGAWVYNRWARFNGFEQISVKDDAATFGGLTVRANGEELSITEDA